MSATSRPIRRRLKARAALAGVSLSDYLLRELRKVSERPTPEEIRQRLAGRTATATCGPLTSRDGPRGARDPRPPGAHRAAVTAQARSAAGSGSGTRGIALTDLGLRNTSQHLKIATSQWNEWYGRPCFLHSSRTRRATFG